MLAFRPVHRRLNAALLFWACPCDVGRIGGVQLDSYAQSNRSHDKIMLFFESGPIDCDGRLSWLDFL